MRIYWLLLILLIGLFGMDRRIRKCEKQIAAITDRLNRIEMTMDAHVHRP